MSAPELMEVAGASHSYAKVNGVRLHYVEAGEQLRSRRLS